MVKLRGLNSSAIQTELAERRLRHFVRYAWPLIEPSTPYVSGWHIDAICEYLEAVSVGQILNLLITVPPRHGKSGVISVMWPAWVWINKPAHRWLYTSYADKLALRDSVRCRRILESNWYRARWGRSFKLTSDQNVKNNFENDKTGVRLTTSVGGGATGEGGDTIVVDDPHNLKKIHSEVDRASVIQWWDEVMSTRLNDPNKSSQIIVMQRAHEGDLAGHVLKQGGYEHLNLPAGDKSEKTTKVFLPISKTTKTRQPGELLWPERFNQQAINRLRVKLGSYAAAAQLDQEPAPIGGGLIKREWWKYYRTLPKCSMFIQSWDTAFKKGQENDFSVGGTFGFTGGDIYILDLWRGKVEFPELKRQCVNTYDRFNGSDTGPVDENGMRQSVNIHAVVVEDKASGQSLIQSLQRDTHLPVLPFKVDSDKVARVNAASPTIEAGRVHLPHRARWLEEFLLEHDHFPNGEHDDQVDMVTQAILWFASKAVRRPRVMVL